MIVRVQLFAVAREKVGAQAVDLEVSEPATVGALRRSLAQHFPALGPLVGKLMFSVNADYADDQTPITSASDIAAIPPVSGG